MSTRANERKRLGRSSEAHQMRQALFGTDSGHRVGVYLWPDAHELLVADASTNGLTVSGMAHRIIRQHYQLPPIP
jgi:hypothetical protein